MCITGTIDEHFSHCGMFFLHLLRQTEKGGEDMSFNVALLREIRTKHGIGRSDFARLLGISEDYLYRFESGIREPGIDFIEKLSHYSGIPIGALFGDFGEGDESCDLPEKPGKPSRIKILTELLRDLNQERKMRKTEEKRASELQKLLEHIVAVNELCVRFEEILLMELSAPEKAKRTAALARETARLGELRFDEIQGLLRLSRSTLKHWLENEKTNYSCKLDEGKTVMASTPGEAGVRLLCFDCEARASEDCKGYGEDNYPENLFVLISLLQANGVYNRKEQAQLLYESYGIEVSPHQISELLSRKKHGKPVPEDIENLVIHKRK
jgi:transcriptional regulator with XRE-family HTH domain